MLTTLGALLLLAYCAYASLSDRHLDQERLYRFSQAVSNVPEIDGVPHNVLGEPRNCCAPRAPPSTSSPPTAGCWRGSGSVPATD